MIGMEVVRGFDQTRGRVATLVPGSDLCVVAWEDGDCEDLHLADMIDQGMISSAAMQRLAALG